MDEPEGGDTLRILLDENIPVQLKTLLPDHIVASVNDKDLGWKNITNGRLLKEMEGRFDLLITADKNIYAQQNFSGRTVSVLVLPTNRRRDVLSLGARIAETIDLIRKGDYLVLGINGSLETKSR